MLRNNRGQWAIIEVVAVVAILLIAAYFIYPHYLGRSKNSAGETVPSPEERAQGANCQINLVSQIRPALNMYQQSNEKFPDSLAELSSMGVTDSMLLCPDTNTPYSYDPGTGRVWCTTPGHEGY